MNKAKTLFEKMAKDQNILFRHRDANILAEFGEFPRRTGKAITYAGLGGLLAGAAGGSRIGHPVLGAAIGWIGARGVARNLSTGYPGYEGFLDAQRMSTSKLKGSIKGLKTTGLAPKRLEGLEYSLANRLT